MQECDLFFYHCLFGSEHIFFAALNQAGCLLCSWFHGKISRNQAENLLHPRQDGLFLVRESTNFPGDYTLCVCYSGRVEHYHILYKDGRLTIDDEEFFDNLKSLVFVSNAFRSGLP